VISNVNSQDPTKALSPNQSLQPRRFPWQIYCQNQLQKEGSASPKSNQNTFPESNNPKLGPPGKKEPYQKMMKIPEKDKSDSKDCETAKSILKVNTPQNPPILNKKVSFDKISSSNRSEPVLNQKPIPKEHKPNGQARSNAMRNRQRELNMK
jgi:hypothetical protein